VRPPVRDRRNTPGRPGSTLRFSRPHFLLSRLVKLKMSSWSERFCVPIDRIDGRYGTDWRIETFTVCCHSERQVLRPMILPRCRSRHSCASMKLSNAVCCWAIVAFGVALNAISSMLVTSVGM
jgi:hypothetical protein